LTDTTIHRRGFRSRSRLQTKTTVLALFFAMFASLSMQGQIEGYRSYEHWYIGLNLGSSNFYGDISGRNHAFNGSFTGNRSFMYGITLTKRFNGVFWSRLNLLTGTIKSVNESMNLQFKSDAVEFSGLAMLSITEMLMGADQDRMFNIYAFVGPGLSNYRSWKREIDTDSLIETEGAGKAKTTSFIIPMGLGLDYRVTDQFTMTAEFSLRNIRSDRMDAHSQSDPIQEGYGNINLGFHYQFDMPEVLVRRGKYNGKSTDPSIRAYNKKKATVMKTKAYKKANRDKRRMEREKKEWLILQLFKKTRLNMATE
jgi:opacity protein-like surface antigen